MSPSKRLYTLTEISDIADISMPTLQKYKKNYSERIPSVGEGRRQRYPREAIKVFRRLKDENLAKRGRGRRRSSVERGRVGRSRRRHDGGLLSLQQIQRLTGISYPTLLRYVKLHLAKLPHVGSGRTRRFTPEAVPVFQELRRQSPRGRRAASGALGDGANARALERRLARLERMQASVERHLREIVRLLRRPVTISLKR